MACRRPLGVQQAMVLLFMLLFPTEICAVGQQQLPPAPAAAFLQLEQNVDSSGQAAMAAIDGAHPLMGVPILSSVYPSFQASGASGASSLQSSSSSVQNDMSDKFFGSIPVASQVISDGDASSKSSSSGESGQASSRVPSGVLAPSSAVLGPLGAPFLSSSNQAEAIGGVGHVQYTFNGLYHAYARSHQSSYSLSTSKPPDSSASSDPDKSSASSPPSSGRDSLSSGSSQSLTSFGARAEHGLVISPSLPATLRFGADNLWWDTVITRFLHMSSKTFMSLMMFAIIISGIYQLLEAAHGRLTLFDRFVVFATAFFFGTTVIGNSSTGLGRSGTDSSEPLKPSSESSFSSVRVFTSDGVRSSFGLSSSDATLIKNAESRTASGKYLSSNPEDFVPVVGTLANSLDISADSRDGVFAGLGAAPKAAGTVQGKAQEGLFGSIGSSKGGSEKIPGSGSSATSADKSVDGSAASAGPSMGSSQVMSDSQSTQASSKADSSKESLNTSPFSSSPSQSDPDMSPSDVNSVSAVSDSSDSGSSNGGNEDAAPDEAG